MSLPRLSKRNQTSPPIGGLDRLITIQTRTAADADGQLTGPYSAVKTLWARIDQVSGKEIVNTGEFAGEVTTKFTTIDIGGIEPRMRISYADGTGATHLCDILFVNRVEERGVFLELLTQEIYSAS